MKIKTRNKILFVVEEFFPITSAPAVRVNSFVKHCSRHSTTEVLCGSETKQNNKNLKFLDVKYYVLHRPPEKNFIMFGFFLIKLMTLLFIVSIKSNPQVIVISIPKYELLLSTIFLKLLGKKIVLDVRDSYSFINYDAYLGHFVNKKLSVYLGKVVKKAVGLLFNASLRLCDYATVANEEIFEEIRHTNPKVIRKLKIVPNGVDINLFRNMNRPSINGSLSVIYIGNFAEKDLFLPIIEAVEGLKEKLAIKVILIGDGRNRYRIEDMINKKELQPYFKFVGKITHNKVPEYINIADVGIILREEDVVASIPVCIFEYMAIGIPVIVNNVGKMAEFVRKRNSGFVINNKSDLEELLSKMSTDKLMLQKRGDDSIEWVSKFGSREVLSKKFYDEVLMNLLACYN